MESLKNQKASLLTLVRPFDLDLACHFDANPDPDLDPVPDPTFHIDTDPDSDPIFQFDADPDQQHSSNYKIILIEIGNKTV